MFVDPLAEQTMEPYLYTGNNPIMFTDPTGMSKDDIIILLGNKRSGHWTGHMAMLIGDDNNGWMYYSMDGGDSTYTDRHTIETFKTIKEFNESPYSAYRSNYDKGKVTDAETDNKGNVIQRYDEAYRIKATPEQDALMNEAAKKETHSKYSELNIGGNNCTQNVRSALDAAGLKNGEYSSDEDIWTIVPNFTPNAKYQEIKQSNKGEDVSNLFKLD